MTIVVQYGFHKRRSWNSMTGLLISVRSESEAREALAGGADLIDIKEPDRGALGAADETVWRGVCRVVAQRCPVSVALGELLEIPRPHRTSRLPEIQFAKVGLAGCGARADWPTLWTKTIGCLPDRVTRVAVAYADAHTARAPSPQQVLSQAIELGCAALLVDTFSKIEGGLFDAMSESALRALVRDARSHGLMVVLGGSLNGKTLAPALTLSPDYVALRGAVCCGARTSRLDRELVRRFAGQLAESRSAKP